jgi:hypothetical protein
MNIDRGASGCNDSRTSMDAPTRNLHSDIKHKSEGNIQSSLCILEHHTTKSYEKMQTGLNSFPPGQYEHGGFIHSLHLFAKRLAEHRIIKEDLLYSLQIFKHITSYTDSERETSLDGPVYNRSL